MRSRSVRSAGNGAQLTALGPPGYAPVDPESPRRAGCRHDERAEVAVSDELFAPVSPGVELCYQTFGDPEDEPLLLVMGLGGPMTWWDADFCRLLAEQRLPRHPLRQPRHRPLQPEPRAGSPAPAGPRRSPADGCGAPYSLADMADDGFGLLDHLGIESAHVCRRLDGRHDRADDGRAAPAAGARPDLDHVDAPASAPSAGRTPRCCRCCSPPRRPSARRTSRRSARFWELIGSPGYPEDPRADPRPGRQDLRPRRQRQRRAAPDAGDPHPAQPRRRAARAADAGRW